MATQIHVAHSHDLATGPAVSFVDIIAAAHNLEATLANQTDAILVSAESVADFQLNPGDLIPL